LGIESILAAAMMGISAGTALLGRPKKPPPPPPAVNPATPAPNARAGGAIVRVGGDEPTEDKETIPEYQTFQEKRVSGKALGGLGRGGLGL
jgi:hypothetical protein